MPQPAQLTIELLVLLLQRLGLLGRITRFLPFNLPAPDENRARDLLEKQTEESKATDEDKKKVTTIATSIVTLEDSLSSGTLLLDVFYGFIDTLMGRSSNAVTRLVEKFAEELRKGALRQTKPERFKDGPHRTRK